MKRLCLLWPIAGLVLGVAGCSQPKMENQPKYETYENAPDWPDGQSARTPPAGTVARDAQLAPRPDHLPVPLTQALLDRGQQRFEINCLPCHGRVGYADGMVVQRGFPKPPSFHSERLRHAPLSHFYDVMTDGYGVMYSYADRVEPADRWAIAAYIRALQQSQHTPVAALDPAQRQALNQSGNGEDR
ncbi:c-type cytochrome [Salinisphaera aquimarina]|uniref:C-type cytochrome n=1 Tax=Salinisphaera aquimarina TaxID=2094031 RepID=A0ABV7EN36_9GAMM